MKLYEYQGRDLLAKFGIRVPNGRVVSTLQELESIKSFLTYPLVAKAQVLVGGRGKAGGIQFADTWEEAKQRTEKILAMQIKGLKVHKVLLVEKLDLAKELYLSLLIDRSSRQILCMASAEGGVDIETVRDDKIHRVLISPLVGLQHSHARQLATRLGLGPDVARQFQSMLPKLYRAFRESDAELLEINPLAITKQGLLVAADAKAVINDSALFRHGDLEVVEEEYTPLEREARASNIAFVELPGRIGVIANGAGLTMATLDALQEFGGQAGVFLDLGGTDNPEQVTRAFRLMRKAHPTVMLLNLFGGITKCDTVARGIKQVLDQDGMAFPIVTCIKGNSAKEANEILREAGVRTAHTLQEAAQLAVDVERGAAAKAAPTSPAAARGGRA